MKEKAEIVAAAEKNWRFAFAASGRLVFSNATGDYAELPIDIGHRIFAKQQPDCRLKKGKKTVSFFGRGAERKRVARIPRSLFANLGKALESVPWAALAPRSPNGRVSGAGSTNGRVS